MCDAITHAAQLLRLQMHFLYTSFVLFRLQGAETVERLNETGQLRQMLKPYKVSYIYDLLKTSFLCALSAFRKRKEIWPTSILPHVSYSPQQGLQLSLAV